MKNLVVLDPEVEKFLKKLRNEELYERLRRAINSLRSNSYPRGAIKMAFSKNAYRIRVGDYRILYQVESNRIVVGKIAHRREVYR